MSFVEPASVPYKTLRGGARMPSIGLGTFGSDRYSGEQVAEAVLGAVRAGYRHIDCAAAYGNEVLVGHALEVLQTEGVPREELWITSKLPNDKHAEEDVRPAFAKSLMELRLEYLDLYLIHWPFPNFHAPKVDVSSRDPRARPYIHENYMRTWRQLELLVKEGLVRYIGSSNMTEPKMRLLLRDAEIKPVVNQIELHPHFQQPELFQFLVDNEVIPVGYSPLGSPSRPERDRTPEDTIDMEDPVILEIAHKRNITPAAVCIKWAVRRGQIPIPFSAKPEQYMDALTAASSDLLSSEEMRQIAQIDRNCRLIKGQVFLWEGAPGWEALWDLDGMIVT